MNILSKLKSIFHPSKRRKEKIPLSLIFSRFRKVIESNTKALEIMADMGDKLSGDYIFDTAYIKQVSKELAESVYQSIHSLNLLCQNKYHTLYSIHERINKKIEALLSYGNRHGPLIKFLDEIGPEDLDLVGGKMARIADIKQHLGYPVPEGFVITSVAFKEFVEHNNLQELIKKLNNAILKGKNEEISLYKNELVSAILKAEISPKLRSVLEGALERYKSMFGDSSLVVRSSAQEEDQELSFAGLFKTVVNVKPDIKKLIEAYKKVVASLFEDKAISYIQKFGAHLLDMSMAVGCLKLIKSRTSGVMFTMNFQDPDLDSILITSNWGLGVAVVEGRFPVDRFLVSRKNPNTILEKEVSKKTKCFECDEEGIKEVDLALK